MIKKDSSLLLNIGVTKLFLNNNILFYQYIFYKSQTGWLFLWIFLIKKLHFHLWLTCKDVIKNVSPNINNVYFISNQKLLIKKYVLFKIYIILKFSHFYYILKEIKMNLTIFRSCIYCWIFPLSIINSITISICFFFYEMMENW